MRFLADSRHRSIALLGGGALLVFVALGTLQWFNTSSVDFLTPATYGQTLVLIALEGLLFLLLLLLLVMLFRNLLKVYVGAGSSGVAARLRSRLVLGAVMITRHPCRAHVSLQLSAHEPLPGAVVLTERLAIARRFDPRGAWSWWSTLRAMPGVRRSR